MDTSAWEAAGLYDPKASDANEQLALLAYLTERGATIDQMVEADRLSGLPGLAGQLLWQRVIPPLSVSELAARGGATVEMVQRILLAAGLPVDAKSELPADLVALVSAFVRGAAIMGEGPLMAFTRVLGSAAINIAEAAVALFYSELGPGSGHSPKHAVARAQMSERATLAFSAVPDAFSALLVTQFQRAVRRSVTVRGPAWTEGSGIEAASERTALGFVDLVGSTAWAQELELREQSLALARFESDAWSRAVLAGGRIVKMIGDEVFFAAPTADAACAIATEVCDWVAADGVLPPARGAVGVGEATSREGDYFGPLVNLVSRLVKVAKPGTVLITAEAADELSPGQWQLRELEPVGVRGIDEPIEAFEVTAAA
jgi:class 3 adenylate cyclase